VYWRRLACVIQRDGPTVILDSREKPTQVTLYKTFGDASEALSKHLREIYPNFYAKREGAV
jgi:hypothetical protein